MTRERLPGELTIEEELTLRVNGLLSSQSWQPTSAQTAREYRERRETLAPAEIVNLSQSRDSAQPGNILNLLQVSVSVKGSLANKYAQWGSYDDELVARGAAQIEWIEDVLKKLEALDDQ
jgi:hypothetical protein